MDGGGLGEAVRHVELQLAGRRSSGAVPGRTRRVRPGCSRRRSSGGSRRRRRRCGRRRRAPAYQRTLCPRSTSAFAIGRAGNVWPSAGTVANRNRDIGSLPWTRWTLTHPASRRGPPPGIRTRYGDRARQYGSRGAINKTLTSRGPATARGAAVPGRAWCRRRGPGRPRCRRQHAEHPRLQVVHQRREVLRRGGPARTAGEQRVAGEQVVRAARVAVQQRDRAGGVAAQRDDLEAGRAERDGVALIERHVRRHRQGCCVGAARVEVRARSARPPRRAPASDRRANGW